MNRLTSLLAAAVLLSGCASAATPASSPVATDPPILLRTAPPASDVAATPAPPIQDLSVYPLPQANDLFRGARIASMAGSPTGAVILGTDVATGALISWTSADGDSWERHWLPGSTFGGGSPELVVGGTFGFVAVGWHVEGPTPDSTFWTSSDGISWSLETDPGIPAGRVRSLVASPAGIAAAFDLDDGSGGLVVSRDGRTWQPVDLPTGVNPFPGDVVAVPDGFLLIGSVDRVDSSGATSSEKVAWRSTDGLAWTADAALAKQLTGLENSIEGWILSPYGAVAWDLTMTGILRLTGAGLVQLPAPPTSGGRLVGGPAGLVWVDGMDASGTCSAAWQYDGAGWVPLTESAATTSCVDTGRAIIIGFAPLAKGILVFGLLGSDYERAAWVVRPAGESPAGVVVGGPIPTAPAAAIPDPLTATFDHLSTCPARPTTIDAMISLDPVLGAGCFGDSDISFRTWVVDPGEGYGGTCQAFTPMWIRECVLADYLLSSGAGVDPNAVGTDELHAQRSTTATGDLAGVGRWVVVTGHYDDAASTTCRFNGAAAIAFEPVPPPALAVLQCRLVFVVTHLRTVPAG